MSQVKHRHKPYIREVITQREAAKILGVHHTYLSRVLTGRLSSKRLTARWNTLLAERQAQLDAAAQNKAAGAVAPAA